MSGGLLDREEESRAKTTTRSSLAAGLLPPLAALLVQYAVWEWIQPFVWFLFYPAVIASSWIDGLRGAILATAVSELGIIFFFLPSVEGWASLTPRTVLSLGIFAGVGATIGLQQEKLRRVTRDLANALGRTTSELATSRDRTSEGQALLASIVSSALDAVISIDDRQRITVFNEAAERMFGCPARDALGASLERFLPSTVRERHRGLVDAFGNSGATTRRMGSLGVLHALRADGSEFPIEASISQATVGGNKTYTVIIRDVTERLRDEKALQESLARFRGTLDAMMEGAQIIDPEWRYVYLNATAGRHARKPIPDLIGRRMMDMYPGIDSTPMFEGMRRCMVERVPVEFETEFVYPDGSAAFFELNIQPAPEGIIVLSVDITEKHRAAERLRELASLLDKATDAIVVRDMQQRVTYWSHGAERLYGWQAGEALGRTIGELIYRDPGPLEKAVAAVARDGEWSGELEQWTRDGRRVLAESRWTLVRDAEGAPTGVLSINTDVTERRDLERRYLRAQRMEGIGTLAGGIAHDLNNVLAPILMAIEVLKAREPDGRSQAVLSTIETSARRGADMVRQILSFARGVEGERGVLDVRHVLRDLRGFLGDTLPPDVKVSVELPPGLPTILGDATQIHQVLLNLCVNARDAMPQGGRITLGAEEASVGEKEASAIPDATPGRFVCLTVTDTGVGIPEEERDRIFEPFFTTKAPGKGTGLGLATVATIVRAHGGFLTVDSAPGRGATFRVYFPALTSPADVDPVRATELRHGNGETVLVVDDEAAVREVTRDTLETFGYRVLLAADGTEALRVHERHGADIAAVITDKVMPGMDGLALIDELRRRDPVLPVILASASADVGPDDPRVAGLHAFLGKPYTAPTLLATLANLPSRRA